jgi:hypothetical protein
MSKDEVVLAKNGLEALNSLKQYPNFHVIHHRHHDAWD